MAQNSRFDKALQRSRKAVDIAFSQSAKRMGLTRDKDLGIYSMLNSDDFQALAQDFGETDVLQYIQEMERKRLLEE